MADKTEILRQMRERNYSDATKKTRAVGVTEKPSMEELKQIANNAPAPQPKKRGPYKKKTETNEAPKKRGPRGPYKKRQK